MPARVALSDPFLEEASHAEIPRNHRDIELRWRLHPIECQGYFPQVSRWCILAIPVNPVNEKLETQGSAIEVGCRAPCESEGVPARWLCLLLGRAVFAPSLMMREAPFQTSIGAHSPGLLALLA